MGRREGWTEGRTEGARRREGAREKKEDGQTDRHAPTPTGIWSDRKADT